MLKYQLLELKKSLSPINNIDNNWFYYQISNQMNVISGYRQGSKKDVEQYLKETLARLNTKYQLPVHSYMHSARKAYEPGFSY